MLILHHLYIYVKHTPRCMPGSLTSGFLWSRCWGYHSQHSWRMRNPQFTYLVRGPWYTLLSDLPKVCQFPFRYKGEDYDECTDKDRPHPWCATNPECEEDCDYSDKDNYGYCFIGRMMWLIDWTLEMWLRATSPRGQSNGFKCGRWRFNFGWYIDIFLCYYTLVNVTWAQWW